MPPCARGPTRRAAPPPGSSSRPKGARRPTRSIRSLHGKAGRRLSAVLGQVAVIPDFELDALAAHPLVHAVSLDRRVIGTMERTGATIGATWARQNLGVDGTGVTVAIIDSGVASWHDDLDPQRIAQFVDFVDFQTCRLRRLRPRHARRRHHRGQRLRLGRRPHRHRAGREAGRSSRCSTRTAHGYISNVIAAFDYAVQHRRDLNIRVINLSVAAGVYESYTTDPLALAARRAVERRDRGGDGGREFREERRRRGAVRRHHRAGQRPVGADRRRDQPQRHGHARRRHDGLVQLARPDASSTTRPSPTWSPPASASSRSPTPARCCSSRTPRPCSGARSTPPRSHT